MRSPARVISPAAASGDSRQIQAPEITSSSAERVEPVDVERDVLAVERDDQAETDDDLGGRDGHHGERKDLSVAVVEMAREGDQRQVGAVEHDLEREQHDERIAPDQNSQRAHAEQEAGHAEVPGGARPDHSGGTSSAAVRE